MSTIPPPAPQKKSSALPWILGIIGGALLILVLFGFLIAGYIVKNIRVSREGREVQIQTPGGSLTVSKTDADAVGLPVYPGAEPVQSGASVQITTPVFRLKSGKLSPPASWSTAAHYRTKDSLDKVDAWYRERLGAEFRREVPSGRHGTLVIQGVHVGGDGIAFVSDRGDFARVVALQPKFSGVEIALVRAGRQEPQ